MGFVGFKTVQDAEVALKYFNRTFIDAMRITTEVRETLSPIWLVPIMVSGSRQSTAIVGVSKFELRSNQQYTANSVLERKDSGILNVFIRWVGQQLLPR